MIFDNWRGKKAVYIAFVLIAEEHAIVLESIFLLVDYMFVLWVSMGIHFLFQYFIDFFFQVSHLNDCYFSLFQVVLDSREFDANFTNWMVLCLQIGELKNLIESFFKIKRLS